MPANATLRATLKELAALAEPGHARGQRAQHELALQLWATGDTAARLLSTGVPAVVALTDKRRHTFDAAMRLQAPWINSLSLRLSVKDIETVHRVMLALRRELEVNNKRTGMA